MIYLRTTNDSVTNSLHLAADARCCLSDAMIPNFLRQLFESLQGIPDLCHAHQALQNLF
jgi:hypothetical protein